MYVRSSSKCLAGCCSTLGTVHACMPTQKRNYNSYHYGVFVSKCKVNIRPADVISMACFCAQRFGAAGAHGRVMYTYGHNRAGAHVRTILPKWGSPVLRLHMSGLESAFTLLRLLRT